MSSNVDVHDEVQFRVEAEKQFRIQKQNFVQLKKTEKKFQFRQCRYWQKR